MSEVVPSIYTSQHKCDHHENSYPPLVERNASPTTVQLPTTLPTTIRQKSPLWIPTTLKAMCNFAGCILYVDKGHAHVDVVCVGIYFTLDPIILLDLANLKSGMVNELILPSSVSTSSMSFDLEVLWYSSHNARARTEFRCIYGRRRVTSTIL